MNGDKAAAKISVYGAGSWGTALAIHLSRIGHNVMLWGRSAEKIAKLRECHCNERYLPRVTLPSSLEATADLARAAAFGEYQLIVIPSEGFRPFLQALAPLLPPETIVLWATKGIEADTGLLLHQVVEQELGKTLAKAVISGPTFAKEVARGLPTAMTVGAIDEKTRVLVAQLFHGNALRMYTSEDMVGIELGGAVKNVLAIAAGISDGLQFGANARAALITRGLAEIMRLGKRMGAHHETLMGLSGLGDLVLTCTDDQSRNRRFGLAVGAGKSMALAIEEIGQVVEGVETAKVVHRVAERHGVEMPISTLVYQILYQNLAPKAAVHALFNRTLKSEY